MSSFSGLSIALSALRAQQYAMDTTGHNIANANTEGYRRQEPVFVANHPLTGSFTTTGVGSQIGTGVEVATIRRTQTDFMDTQIRMENQWLGMWSSRSEALQQIEPLLSEPGDSGLSAALDRFWNSWQDLAASPESLPARIAVVESGVALSDRIRNLHYDLYKVQEDADRAIAGKSNEINWLAQEIASLNAQTIKAENGQYQPNDLMDRRDLLVEQLARITRIEVHGSGGSNMIISVGGRVLVQGNYAAKTSVGVGPTGWSQIVWSEDNSPLPVNGGELKGLTDVRDTLAAGYMASLDTITQAIVARVNAIHVTGFDMNGNPAGDFFTAGTGASNVTVNSALLAAPSGVAASGAAGEPGNNSVANAMAGVRGEALVGGQTARTAYTALVTQIGSHARESAMRTSLHEVSLKQRKMQRESIAGVSIDEEMANMMKFQQAYNAAARIFTVMNEMLDTIINRM